MESTIATVTESTSTAIMERRRRRIPRRPIAPEVGSLYDILHDHAGLSLFTIPICWTKLHARLLGCRFVQLPAQQTPMPTNIGSPRRSPNKTPPTVVSIGRDLDILMATHSIESPRQLVISKKSRAMRKILSTLFPSHLSKSRTSPDLDLRFGSRVYPRAVRCEVVWRHPDAGMVSFDSATTWASSNQSASQLMASMTVTTTTSHSDGPMLAYVNRDHLNHVRTNCFRIMSGPNRTFNGPVHRLQTLRSKKLIPENLDEDQYFMAIMIAMAQQAVYPDVRMGEDFAARDVKVAVLTVSEDENCFLVYSATIPSAFLALFHAPDKAPPGAPDFAIEYAQVPVWPVLGLKERLGKALGRDVVGEDFTGSPMHTYEDELTASSSSSSPETPSPKRRREVLSEVLNGSFSSTDDRDASSSSSSNLTGVAHGDILGKRRRLEEGRVGVVR